jgi:hypothetical protein
MEPEREPSPEEFAERSRTRIEAAVSGILARGRAEQRREDHAEIAEAMGIGVEVGWDQLVSMISGAASLANIVVNAAELEGSPTYDEATRMELLTAFGVAEQWAQLHDQATALAHSSGWLPGPVEDHDDTETDETKETTT